MLDKNSLQLQYIIDEAGNKKAVIISHSQFEELLQNMATLAKRVEKDEKSSANSATKLQTMASKKLPAHFVPDSFLFSEIQSALLMEMSEQAKPPIILQGSSGTGKSVLASALVRDVKIRETFAENIFWFNLGTDVEVLAHQITLIQALGGSSNVLEAEDILAFHVGGERYQLLVTTTENNMLEVIQYFIKEAKNYTLKPFSEKQAITFFIYSLARPNVTVSSIPIDMKQMVQACGYLPLALKLIANLARQGPLSKLKTLLDRLLNEDYEFPNKYPRALMQALQLNLELLGDEGDYYMTLAVFGGYSRIPESVVLMLWRYL